MRSKGEVARSEINFLRARTSVVTQCFNKQLLFCCAFFARFSQGRGRVSCRPQPLHMEQFVPSVVHHSISLAVGAELSPWTSQGGQAPRQNTVARAMKHSPSALASCAQYCPHAKVLGNRLFLITIADAERAMHPGRPVHSNWMFALSD